MLRFAVLAVAFVACLAAPQLKDCRESTFISYFVLTFFLYLFQVIMSPIFCYQTNFVSHKMFEILIFSFEYSDLSLVFQIGSQQNNY